MKEYLDNITKTLEEIHPGCILLFATLGGSHSYGTDTDTSDVDFRGVYLKNRDHIGLDHIKYDDNNSMFYDLNKFSKMLINNNPGAIELIHTTEDCIIYTHPLFEEFIKIRSQVLSRKCEKTFLSYGVKQIKKADGQDKMMNWKKDRTERKVPFDFTNIFIREKSINLLKYLEQKGLNQLFCGVSKLQKAKDDYAVFYDYNSHNRFSVNKIEIDGLSDNFLKFKGIFKDNSNDIRLSSIPKDIPDSWFIGHINFNVDGYSKHCSDYNKYLDFCKNMNEDRWITVEDTDKKMNAKNMMHCRRVIGMIRELAEGKGFNMKRPDREYLLNIKYGKINLKTLIEESIKDFDVVKELMLTSDLPNEPNPRLVLDISDNIKKVLYGIE